MSEPLTGTAFGAPGFPARWTQSTKEGIGTAYHTSCRLWFTLSHGIVNEIYYPHVDQPCTRDFQFLITDGETFCHEERRDLDHALEYPEKGALLYRIINSDRAGRYRIIKEICTDPHSSVLLTQTRIEIADESLRPKLRIFALLAPHLIRGGMHNNAALSSVGGRNLVRAWRDNIHLVMGCEPDFTRRSVGYVGASDGWQDLQNFAMDWEFNEALDGNVALTAEVDLSRGFDFVIAVAMGRSKQSAATKLLQSLGTSFATQRDDFVLQWHRSSPLIDNLRQHTGDAGTLASISCSVLLAHEDKTFVGALVASMSIPWGETKGDDELGGYHLVWGRDIVQSALGLLASGRKGTAFRALIWLACLQEASGRLPQNSWISGEPYWVGLQLDEIAAPVLLAWKLHEEDALGLFDPRTLIMRAARFLILNGPVTKQERWEENAGYSPSTLASITAAMVCAAQYAKVREEDETAEFLLDYADWLSSRIESWTVTTRGELLPGTPRHYVRITPSDPFDPRETADPDGAFVQIANGGGSHPARNVVSGDFLQLVRLGLRSADDPLIRDSLTVIDAVLKYDLPQGPCWRRYNHDGYGQRADGGAFDGTGVGGCWPLLTGERGHYELAAGRDPLPFIKAMECFSNAGDMLPEQVAFGLTSGFQPGAPTGSAMPLCWAHAEYLSLVRSRADGVGFDRVEPAYERYVRQQRRDCEVEIWTNAHRIAQIRAGRTLRVITAGPADVSWRTRGDMDAAKVTTKENAIGLWSLDLDTRGLTNSTVVEFAVTDQNGTTDLQTITIAGE